MPDEGVRPEIQAMSDWLKEVRRDIHMHPEIQFQEHRTAGKSADILKGYGLDVKTGVAETGVTAFWKGSGEGPVLGIRADMDALPIQEVDDRPYASKTPGLMHACGHDAHVTIALGVGRYLSEHGSHIKGGVKLFLQPAEEGGGGALKMIEEGSLENPKVDRMVSLHVWPKLPAGKFGMTSGPANASSDELRITIKGKGSHAAYPHDSKDPIIAGAALVLALQNIVSRHTDPLASLVISVTRFVAGTATNIIPENAEIWGTIRALSQSIREKAHEKIRTIAKGILEAHGVEADVDIRIGYPVMINDPEVTDFATEVVRSISGQDGAAFYPPTMGAEDFSYFLQKCPGTMLRLGCAKPGDPNPPMLHTPQFDMDEDCLLYGVEYFIRFAEAYLGVK